MLKETQEAMIDVMVDLHQGHINTQLVTPNQLRDQLRLVKQWLPSKVQVPDYDQHWVQLFRIIRARARLVNNHLIFELTIPLLGQEIFQIYSVYAVPTSYKTQMVYIQPSASVILVNLHRTWYYLMEGGDLEKCHAWERNQVVCTQYGALFAVQSEDKPCELRLLQHETYSLESCSIRITTSKHVITPLQRPNSWLMSLAQEERMDLICNDTLRHFELKGSGILSLPPNCQAKGQDYMLVSRDIVLMEQPIPFLPAFNLSQKMLDNPDLALPVDLSEDLQEVKEAIQILHATTDQDNINIHDVHHYSLSCGGIIIMAIFILAWWRRGRLLRLLYREKQNQTETHRKSAATRRRRISV